MLILSLNSAGVDCGACVWRDGKILADAEERMERGQDQRLMPLVMDVMKKARINFDALDRIAVTRGPGSFTGLRIGLATARGIGLAADKPVIGISRFAIFREQIKELDKNLLVVIGSKRKELFCRFYPVGGAPAEPTMMTVDEITDFLKEKKDTLLTGDEAMVGVLHIRNPAEREVITCAILAARANTNDVESLPRPLYLRAPDVTISRRVTSSMEQAR